MRVGLVIAGPYPAARGSQVLVSHLALGLRARGHQVHVVSYGSRRGERPGPRPTRLLLDAMLVGRVWRACRRHRLEVLHAHNYEAAIASLVVGRATGRPVVYHGHSAHADELPLYVMRPWTQRWMRRMGRLLDRQVPRRADFCIAVSEALADSLVRGGVAEDRLACVHPAMAPGELDAGALDVGTDGLVCYAGNLDPYQRLDFLLESFALLRAIDPAARLRLVSHPDARKHAARLVARGLGAGVEIVLAPSYAEVCAEIRRAGVVVCPRAEASGFPMKLLTYLGYGKAVVACAGSAKGLVDGVTARIVDDGDAPGFAAAMGALLWTPAERRRLGRAARRVAEDRAMWDAGLDRVEAIYGRILAAGAGRLPSPPVPLTATE
jgi:1,2-diacylglycerol 3-alpha-glucosyltransferase